MKAGHAVIIGGSIAGMLAAGAAARHLERVTVLERDSLIDGPVVRKGAPQGNQIHILLAKGERAIEDLFPGIHREFVEAGCEVYNHTGDIPILSRCGWLPRVELKETAVLAFRRPLLEWVIRKRLLHLDNVEISHATAIGLTTDDTGAKVAGVEVKGGATIPADLVVDAGGRGTKSPKWLKGLGFDTPQEAEVRVYMGYATQFVRFTEDGVLKGNIRGIVMLADREQPIGLAVLPADNGVHSVAAFGLNKNYPPADRAGVLDFLAQAPTPLFAEIVSGSEPVSEVYTYRMPGSKRRLWEDLERPPGRFLATGDAVASFNPLYGQGMTMAALGARHLDLAFDQSGAALDSVPTAFQRSLAKEVDVAFQIAAGGDAFQEGAELRNFKQPTEEEARFHEQLAASQVDDVEVAQAVAEATFGMRPEALEEEAIKAKIEAPPPQEKRAVDLREFPTEIHPEMGGKAVAGATDLSG